MKKEIYIPIAGLVAGELIMFYVNIITGLGIHIINFLGIIFIIIFSNLSIKEKNILQSLTLLILLRMINLSLPPFFTTASLQYILIYGMMFVPIYLTIKNQHISFKELGINFDMIYIHLPIYFMMAFTEMIKTVVLILIFIGFEEFIFRSLLQTNLEKIFGLRYGLLFSGGIFGIMHMRYGTLNEILSAIIFGVTLGYIFQKTRNILFTISIHGIANVIFGFPNMIISTQNISSKIISGEFLFIILIIILSISFLVSYTKYSNRYISNTLKTYSNPLLLTFVAIVIYKIILKIP